jgi:uncharacterized repeat protein (TIGR04076 family)
MDLIVRVRQIKGTCPVYEVGDTFTLEDGYRLSAGKPICMHSLASLMPYYNALRFCEPMDLGLVPKDDPSKLVVQCCDPVDHTGGGTVTFEISKT